MHSCMCVYKCFLETLFQDFKGNYSPVCVYVCVCVCVCVWVCVCVCVCVCISKGAVGVSRPHSYLRKANLVSIRKRFLSDRSLGVCVCVWVCVCVCGCERELREC